jgi:tRNA (guanine-N7-)-methyltransferase
MSELLFARTIRSFVKREVRITDAQIRAIEKYYPVYGFNPEQLPSIVEIGFGDGESLFNQAQLFPETQFLGIEVHRPGLGIFLNRLAQAGLTNVRVAKEDALDVLAALPNESLAGIQIFFPDPWQKNRHRKRRLIQPSFLDLAIPKLKTGGFIHCATDWKDYAEQMLEVLSADPRLKNTSPTQTTIERPPHRILSKFERRGIAKGHEVWDFMFIAEPAPTLIHLPDQ